MSNKCHFENGEYKPCDAVIASQGVEVISKDGAVYMNRKVEYCPFCGGKLSLSVDIKRSDLMKIASTIQLALLYIEDNKLEEGVDYPKLLDHMKTVYKFARQALDK